MTSITAAVRVAAKNFIFLDYTVPDCLPGIAPGWGVICPLRDKLFDGIVMAVHKSPGDKELKPIHGLAGEGPVVPPALITLASWVSEHYLVDLSSAVGLVFPPFARGKWVDRYQIEGGKEDLRLLTNLLPAAAPVTQYMLDRKQFSREGLEANFGPELTEFCLRWLQEAGFVSRDRHFTHSRRQGGRGNAVTLELEEPEVFIRENRRALKQIAVVEALLRHGGKALLEVLLQDTGVSRTIIKELEKKKAIKLYHSYEPWEPDPVSFDLTSEQEKCLSAITAGLAAKESGVILLHGITGSGKTEVYVRAAQFAVKFKEKVIVVVPEIALSSQIIRYFQKSFGLRAVILHSKLSSAERYQTWRTIRSGEADVVIGTRSAVFAPFTKVGLIIIDEEHDKSLKQDTTPRYHCFDVARERCRMNNALLLLGSATPSLESYFLAQSGEIRLLEMLHRIRGTSPEIKLVDMRAELRKGNNSILSSEMKKAIEETLGRGEQVIAFLNRRGYASFVSCRDCGHVFRCEHCDITLTYHSKYNCLKCHYCGFSRKTETICPQCHSDRMKTFGVGTEKVENALRLVFPERRILRLDSDTTSKTGAHDRIVGSFMAGEYDILVGTQMVTKGFDFPGVTLVCVIAADIDLNLPDFRAEERTFQLLTQVAGRSGRREKPGTVIIQTYSPGRPAVALLAQGRQKDFYDFELRRRKELGYPPYSRFVRLLFSGRNEAGPLQSAERVAEKLVHHRISFMGPAPAPIERIKDAFRWHLIIKGLTEGEKDFLIKVLEEERKRSSNKVNIIVDIDPQSLM